MNYFLFFLLLVVAAVPAHADQLYRWVDSDGVTHFSDSPPKADGTPSRIPRSNTSIPIRSNNYESQRSLNQINRVTSQPRRNKSSRSSESTGSNQAVCESYRKRIASIDSRLRAGGYSVSQGNRLRAERREVSGKRSRECLLNQ